MNYTEIKLKADAFTLSIKPGQPLNGWFTGTISLDSTYLQNCAPRDELFYCPFEDWLELCDYIESHINKLLELGHFESQTWVTSDLMLQATCLTGELYYEYNELAGRFVIRIMVKFGSDEDANYANIGFEGGVEVSEVIAFCQALREYVNSQKEVLVGVSG